jgi:hypothetical protein
MTTSQETLFIGGGWAAPGSAATIEVRNASTGEHVSARSRRVGRCPRTASGARPTIRF